MLKGVGVMRVRLTKRESYVMLHADNYFGLQEDLERLFGVRIELVEPGPIRNPYFRQAIEKTQVLLYAAA